MRHLEKMDIVKTKLIKTLRNEVADFDNNM